jgi:FkbM family methyltransferase
MQPGPFSLAQMLGKACPTIDIVDVGAMALGSAPEYASILKAAPTRLVGFEPVQAECDKLNARKTKNQTYLPYFIGDGSKRKFHLTNFSMTSSLYEPDTALLSRFNNLEELTRVVDTCEAPTTRLDDVPEITNIDFLKIDIQGAELDTFRGASRLLKDCLLIQTEVEFIPMYKDQPLFADVDIELRKHGLLLHCFLELSGRAFKPVVVSSDINKPLRQAIWSDAIYVRNFMTFHELREEQLLKLAVLAHDLIGSFDLAQLALQYHEHKFKKGLWPLYMKRLTNDKPDVMPLDQWITQGRA